MGFDETSIKGIRGVIPVLPTPFNDEEEIDYHSVRILIEYIKHCDCDTICLPAFGSEFYKLSNFERRDLLDFVFDCAGSLNIIVQCNHPSPKVLKSVVQDAEKRGAYAVNTALPRMIPVSDNQLLKYAESVCDMTSLPVIIQDFNPGGAVIGADFAVALSKRCENFRFIKQEIPGIGTMVSEIFSRTNGKVQVLSGWGGSYMLEQFPAGIAGIMPGISLLDVFQRIWRLLVNKKSEEALNIFSSISPYLLLSLQNLEVFHHCEKRLAFRRGLIARPVVRSITAELDAFQDQYLNSIIDFTLTAIRDLEISHFQTNR